MIEHDDVREVGIDQAGRLYVVPCSATFPHIYREGMEVCEVRAACEVVSPANVGR